MFCSHCGKPISDSNQPCPACGGGQSQGDVPVSGQPAAGSGGNYVSIFWKFILFNILIGATCFATVAAAGPKLSQVANIFYWVFSGILLYWFCRAIGKAMQSVGKSNWWPLGLLAMVPFGFWVAYFVARSQLKPRGQWGREKVFLIVIITAVLISAAAIFAGIVLISMSGARIKARDAVRISHMRQMAAAQNMWYAENQRFYTCSQTAGDCLGKMNNFPENIGEYLNEIFSDPSRGRPISGVNYAYAGLDNNAGNGEEFCYYAKLESGGYFAVSQKGEFRRISPPQTMADCQTEN